MKNSAEAFIAEAYDAVWDAKRGTEAQLLAECQAEFTVANAGRDPAKLTITNKSHFAFSSAFGELLCQTEDDSLSLEFDYYRLYAEKSVAAVKAAGKPLTVRNVVAEMMRMLTFDKGLDELVDSWRESY